MDLTGVGNANLAMAITSVCGGMRTTFRGICPDDVSYAPPARSAGSCPRHPTYNAAYAAVLPWVRLV